METRYPIRKEDGKDFATLNEVLEQLSKEKHGQWLVGNNSMWHGGIHISPSSAPDSKIERQEDAASAIPLQCIAGGESCGLPAAGRVPRRALWRCNSAILQCVSAR